MKVNLYSIKDNKTGFMQPRCDMNHKAAIRAFELTLATVSGDTVMGFCPEDFDFYYVGQFDTESGIVSALPTPEFLKSGSSHYCAGNEV